MTWAEKLLFSRHLFWGLVRFALGFAAGWTLMDFFRALGS